ncbi:XRE family transcriptional regulator [Pleomorphovibrio marinus]|uniref:XRE family transcriptional regulator n=1 Tax=Pleomorphovibrio marinus TaxID=2164132 RepID=UPI000E0C8C42|nr:helix-turn-helix domain-containing protein [Pleomorphovibrio marinus]
MHVHANIKFLRKRKGVTQAMMAEAVGISRSKLAGYELNVNPPLETVIVISEYLEVSVDLLLKENLSAYSPHRLGEVLETNRFLRGRDLRVLATTVDAEGKEFIEVVSQRAKASYLAGFSDPDFIGDLPRFSLPFLPADKKHRVFQVDGDSMEPIPDGAWIVCSYLEDWMAIRDGEKYVIVTGQDGVTFKLAYNLIAEQRKLLLCSSNPAYRPFEVCVEDIREVWKYRMMMM